MIPENIKKHLHGSMVMGEHSFLPLVSILPFLDEIRFIGAEVLQLNHRWGSAQTFWSTVQMAV